MFFSRPAGWQWVDRGLVTDYDFPIGDFIKDSSWYEKDLSAIVGKGVKLVSISIGMNCDENDRQMALRTHGQENTKNMASMFSPVGVTMAEHTLQVLTDADGKIDYYCQLGTWTILQFVIRGWFVP